MEWRHNIVAGDSEAPLLGVALTAEDNEQYALWLHDPQGLAVRRVKFNAQGQLGKGASEPLPIYDALLPEPDGYVLARYRNGVATLTGHVWDHKELWLGSLPEADSPCWSSAKGSDGKLYILYGSCNPHDAYRQAHIVTVDQNEEEPLQPFFTVPDDDYPMPQILISMPERLAVCVKSRGAATVFYIIDHEGEVIRSGAFSMHPHSKWAVPLCHTPLENGDILMGGYKEDVPGQRQAWVCRFDAELSALNGKVVAGDAQEQAITAFAPQPDGSVLALCPPWKILRLSPKGLVTHAWEVPAMARRNMLTAILSAPGGGCFITGRSFAGKVDALEPAIWLGKLNLNEFVEL